MMKSPTNTIFFKFLPFYVNMFLKSVSHGGLWIVLRITFLDLVLDISVERLN